MRQIFGLIIALLLFSPFCYGEERSEEHHVINFSHVKACELVRFVSRITKTNFAFKDEDLDFEMSFISGKDLTNKEILQTLFSLLRQHGYGVKGKQGSYTIEKRHIKEAKASNHSPSSTPTSKSIPPQNHNIDPPALAQEEFCVYKLQYHQGDEILVAIKQMAMGSQNSDPEFFASIQSMQWIKTTNSLVSSGSSRTNEKILSLVKILDIPQKQVFIEVLVVETDVGKGQEFGLNWSANSQYKNRLGISIGNQPPSSPSMGDTITSAVGSGLQTLSKFPSPGSFGLGVIGDIITHNGSTFLSLGSLISALQSDLSSSIVLNQKVIAQDNKCSKVFVGRNIPFAGAIVETVGQTQQTTANIEYRNIGTTLNITPYIGDNGIITMEIEEEISEAHDQHVVNTKQVNGIETSQTNMVTRVHVPDAHFVAVTGMVRNKKKQHKTGLPCLGGLPWIGSAFSKTSQSNEKRDIIIFVRPRILNTFDDIDTIAKQQMDDAKKSPLAEELIDDIFLDEMDDSF